MKMEFCVRILNDDGTEEIIEATKVDTNVPNFEEFKDSSNFREVFDRYEKAVLIARNTVAEQVSEHFLTELSKKNK